MEGGRKDGKDSKMKKGKGEKQGKGKEEERGRDLGLKAFRDRIGWGKEKRGCVICFITSSTSCVRDPSCRLRNDMGKTF